MSEEVISTAAAVGRRDLFVFSSPPRLGSGGGRVTKIYQREEIRSASSPSAVASSSSLTAVASSSAGG